MPSKVEVRLYSVLREVVGSSVLHADASETETVGRLLERLIGGALEILRERNIDLIILDEEGRKLSPQDRLGGRRVIHVMPPPSGGGNTVLTGLIRPGDDSWEVLSRALKSLSSLGGPSSDVGAVAVFIGIVRGDNRGASVRRLIYEAAEDLAEKKLRELAEWAASSEGVRGVAAYHATGPRLPGDVTMIVAVAGVGRTDVFPVLTELVDRIKHEVPIWKAEEREDGVAYILGDNRVVKADQLKKSKP